MRRLAIVPAVLLLAIALMAPTAALGASGPTAGYNQEPNKPSTGTSPSKETSTPSTTPKETAPATETSTPAAEKTSTLPFTGFDLRWDIGAGLLLMGAGFSIVVVQRRQRRQGGR